jgi:hypothetical protein
MEQTMILRKILLSGVAAALFGVLGVAATATSASAYVVCNRDGDCWHTDRRDRVPGVRFEYHPDDWYFHQRWNDNRDRHWRERREGRGYWRNGVWLQF